MQSVEHKKRRGRPRLRLILLILAGLAAAALAVWFAAPGWVRGLLGLKEPDLAPAPTEPPVVLVSREESEVRAVDVTLETGEHWRAETAGDGMTVMTADGVFPVKSALARMLIADTAVLQATRVLSADRSTLSGSDADFGLDPARETVTVTYADGTAFTFRVGSRCDDADQRFYYMTVDGDPRLFALDVTTAEDLGLEARQLIDAGRLDIQSARIDRIEVESGGLRRVWELDGEITDADAVDRWMLTEPVRYPADAEAIANLKQNCVNLYLNGYIGPADEASRAAHGLDEPYAVITIHMAAGTTYRGTYVEETVTVRAGGLREGLQRFAEVNGGIYQISAFHVSGIVDARPEDTLSRYPVRTALGNLETLILEKGGETVTWRITREKNADGETVSSVTRNGEPMGWEAFAQRYNRMIGASAAGTLPEGYVPGEPHTRWIFRSVGGEEHIIGLSDYDASHDAVAVDGAACFYIRKNALSMDAE